MLINHRALDDVPTVMYLFLSMMIFLSFTIQQMQFQDSEVVYIYIMLLMHWYKLFSVQRKQQRIQIQDRCLFRSQFIDPKYSDSH